MEIAEALRNSIESNDQKRSDAFLQQIKDFQSFEKKLDEAGVKANKVEYTIPLMGRISAFAI